MGHRLRKSQYHFGTDQDQSGFLSFIIVTKVNASLSTILREINESIYLNKNKTKPVSNRGYLVVCTKSSKVKIILTH